MSSLLLGFVCGDGDGAVFDGAESARGRVVTVRGGGLSSRPDEGGDHIDFTPFLVIGSAGRENEEVGVCGCGNVRVAFQEAGKLAKSGNERLPLGCAGVGHMTSVPSGLLSISVIPSGPGYICHAPPMRFQCGSNAASVQLDRELGKIERNRAAQGAYNSAFRGRFVYPAHKWCDKAERLCTYWTYSPSSPYIDSRAV